MAKIFEIQKVQKAQLKKCMRYNRQNIHGTKYKDKNIEKYTKLHEGQKYNKDYNTQIQNALGTTTKLHEV